MLVLERLMFVHSPAGINLLKVNSRNTRNRVGNMFKIWTYFTLCSSVSIVNFKHVIAGWEVDTFQEISLILISRCNVNLKTNPKILCIMFIVLIGPLHCVRSVHIRSFSGPYFPEFVLNREIYEVNLRN